MLQCGVREPMHIAADAATLDILAPGRVLLGLGAGHTPGEWQDVGRQRPPPAERVGRLREVVEIVVRLLAGETVTLDGQYVQVHEAGLQALPVGGGITIAVGGGHPDLLRLGAERADVVAVSGLGRTLPDGHRHEVRWSPTDLQTQLCLVQDGARRAGRKPVLDALVQWVIVTDHRKDALVDLARGMAGPPVEIEHLATTPHLLVGTHEEMARQLVTQAQRWGISSYVVREAAIPDMEPVLAMLAHAGHLRR